jgi:very-short-patch-repair endonuclease
MKEYNKENIPLAKSLRKNMTRHEKKLWYDFLKNYDVRFQRQKALGNYIADFYCAKAGLVVELDGSGHYRPMQIIKDAERTSDLEKLGLTVIRICNLDIDRKFNGVCTLIDNTVKQLIEQRTAKEAST